jgi:hypothetical protein
VADGGAAGLLRGWLRRFHAQGSSAGFLAGPRPG